MSGAQFATAQTQGWYQTPALNDQALIFASEGDLWRAEPTGGTAVRLTTHSEIESSPMLSPDGRRIAFDASYDGPSEIYVMPATGGVPERVTFEGGGVTIRGWLDDSHLLYRTTNLPGTVPMMLRILDLTTGKTEDIPLSGVDQAALSDDGSTLFFTRYGLSMFNDNAVLYRGGRMAQLWRYEMGSNEEAVRLAANFEAPIRHPMVSDGVIYFVSDKSGTDNFWSIPAEGGAPTQLTSFSEGQIRSPYLFGGEVVYQSGADLFRYDISANTAAKLDLFLMSDGDYQRDRWISDPLSYLEDARIAPSGDSVTITARGRFTTGFTRDRRRVEYQVPDGYRARSANVSGDGDWVYVILDGDKQGEIWRFPTDGLGEGEAVTSGSDTYIWSVVPVPDSADFLYTDKKGRLFLYDAEAGAAKEIDKTPSSNDYAFGDFSWSGDGRYLVYTGYDGRDIPRVMLYDTETSENHELTSGKYESHSPAFSRDGDWLYFISNRHFDASPGSPWGDRNMGPAFDERGKLYALQLNPEADFPFEIPNELDLDEDDESDADESEEESEDEEDAAEDEAESSTLVLDGLAERLWEVPVESGNYYGLATSANHLIVLEDDGSSNAIMRVKFTSDDPDIDKYTGDVTGFEISSDGKKLMVQKGRGSRTSFYLVNPDKSFPSDTGTSRIRISDWKLRVNAKEEWQQMAHDAWRLHRDFAFDPGLRDVDWEAVGDRFLPLAERIGHRVELNDFLAQMVAELGILHSQVRTGDLPSDDEGASSGFLGATYSEVGNGLLIDDIYQGERDHPRTLGPLLKPGVDIEIGDIITGVDGRSISSKADLGVALTMKAGDQVLIEFTRAGEEMKEIVTPVSSGTVSRLRYADWVQSRRDAVAEKTDDKFGYLHLRAMGASDLESFVRDFYEHFDKDGLIIDVRGNRGGNVDSVILANLLRRAWAFWNGLEGGPVYTNMQQAFRGHLIILIDEGTYSDGETFSAGAKALDLAPLLGTRTAGAGIWLSDRNRLSDRGQARVAEYGQFGLDGRWLVEGRGVSPDIEVENLPHASYLGEDAQLDAAIAWLEEKLTTDPIPELVPQPIPPVGEYGQDVE